MSTNFYVEQAGRTIHLGKRSAGWPFLYHADPSWTPDNAYANWTALLVTGRIVDEYGQEYTADQMTYEANEWEKQARLHQLFSGQYSDAAGRRFSPAEFC